MRRSERIQAVLWALFGLYIMYEGFLLKLGTGRAPRPGFMLFWVGVVIVILAAFFFLGTFTTPAREQQSMLWREGRWLRGAKLAAALFLYVAVFQRLGFIPSTFLLLLYMFKGLEPQSWPTALLLSAVTVAICYLVFGVFLELQFPPGVLSIILT